MDVYKINTNTGNHVARGLLLSDTVITKIPTVPTRPGMLRIVRVNCILFYTTMDVYKIYTNTGNPVARGSLLSDTVITREGILRCKLWSENGEKGAENSQEKEQKRCC